MREWYEALVRSNAGHWPRGAVEFGPSGGIIWIKLLPLRGVREEAEALLDEVGIPEDAFELTVGCRAGYEWSPEDPREDPAAEGTLGSVELWLEAPTQAAYGETVRLQQTLKNVGDDQLTVRTGIAPENFIITTPDGLMVWRWGCGKIVPLISTGLVLEPGRVARYSGEWEQVDNRGEPVPAGTYVVYGTYSGDWGEGRVVLITEPHELQVVR